MKDNTLPFDCTGNPKQSELIRQVMLAASGYSPYRYFFYGGAIRGGKTFGSLAAILLLLRRYKGAQAHVVRKHFSELLQTTIPSVKKLGATGKWIYRNSSAILQLRNGSQLHFFPESYTSDKDLNRFKGLETNFFLLEQIEDIQRATWQKAIERAGSHRISPMPPPLVLSTFNPTHEWVRKEIYDTWAEGKLKAPYYYMQATHEHNPYITDEQREGWKLMDPENYKRYVLGNWNFEANQRLFAYSFKQERNAVDRIEYDDKMPLYLSFDFNVDPLTCIAAQHTGKSIAVLKEFRLRNADIFMLCEAITAHYPAAHFLITGDASGAARSVHSQQHFYQIIRKELKVYNQQIRVPRSNPPISASRLLLNSLLHNYPSFQISTGGCPHLIQDLESVEATPDGSINKKADPLAGHLLDCLRYYLHTFHSELLQHGGAIG